MKMTVEFDLSFGKDQDVFLRFLEALRKAEK